MHRRTFIGAFGSAALVALTGCGAEEVPRATTGSSTTTTPAVNITPTQTRAVELTQVAAALAPTATTVATATPAPTATSAATATPTRIPPTATAPPAKIEVVAENVSNYRDSIGTLWYVGEVVNKGQGDAGDIKVAISLLNDTGQTAAAGSSSTLGLPVVKAGGKTVWRALVDKAPEAWREERIQVQAGPVSSFARGYYYYDLKLDGLTVTPPANQYSSIAVTGQVLNTGTATAQYVQITVGIYDAAGKLLRVADGSAKLDQIAPGGTAPFSVEISGVKAVPAKFEAYVRGTKVA